ncbi:MAG: small subunit ribosomal protein S4 [Parcubacteria group bacterium Gr01-1014_44]|nr:MAG: small subunit ribosomal protein S4 [Parcubacteria group bacterium Gr01-1014_44]
MARYTGPKEKLERRIGTKLFLKGERSLSPKSATVRKPYPPGMHGKAKFKKLSEYGLQLQSKQKIKYIYRLLEKQFKRYVKEAMKSKKETTALLIKNLEERLDNTVYRMGLAQSRDQARQLVNHGHILVNKVKTNIPSFRVKKGDQISIREGSKNTKYFSVLLPEWFAKHESPDWIKVEKNIMTGTIEKSPDINNSGLEFKDIRSIIEYYSK